MQDLTPDLQAHLETFAGTMIDWWDTTTDERELAASVVKFRSNSAPDGTVTISTLGLSEHQLEQPSGQSIRQELLLCCDEAFGEWKMLPRLVEWAAQDVLASGSALLRGERVGGFRGVLPNSSLSSLYVSTPWFWPSHAHTLEVVGCDEPVIFASLVPITQAELDVLNSRGWEALEDEFVAREVDLYDLGRH